MRKGIKGIAQNAAPSLLDAFSRRSGLLGTSCDRFCMSFLPIRLSERLQKNQLGYIYATLVSITEVECE